MGKSTWMGKRVDNLNVPNCASKKVIYEHVDVTKNEDGVYTLERNGVILIRFKPKKTHKILNFSVLRPTSKLTSQPSGSSFKKDTKVVKNEMKAVENKKVKSCAQTDFTPETQVAQNNSSI
jgi:hypothetical protein